MSIFKLFLVTNETNELPEVTTMMTGNLKTPFTGDGMPLINEPTTLLTDESIAPSNDY